MTTLALYTTGDSRVSSMAPNALTTMPGEGFFDNYYSWVRFGLETTVACISVLSNTVMLLLFRGTRHQRHYSYIALFKNLLVANVLSTVTSWLTNNLIFLFRVQMEHMDSHCHSMLLMLTANVITKVFGAVSVLSLLGLSVVHCLAVCYPIAYVLQMNTTRVHVTIFVCWSVTSLAALMEILVCVGRLTSGHCGENEWKFISMVLQVDANITIVCLTASYVIIIALCARIAVEIRTLEKRLSRLCWTDNLQQERGTFRSIVGLSITMTLFIFPYHVLYFASMNFNVEALSANTGVMYYMNLLPYAKFATDPVFFCRKRLVHWRGTSCMSLKLCHSDETTREERSLIDDRLSGLSVNGHGACAQTGHPPCDKTAEAAPDPPPPSACDGLSGTNKLIVTLQAGQDVEQVSSFV